MPYRRLPNTDQARIRALNAIAKQGENLNVYELAFSLKSLSLVRNFLIKFDAAHTFYLECFERQSKAGHKHTANAKMARLYLSHFIQVLNLAVIRSEIRASHKDYYGLDVKNHVVPDLTTDAGIADWGMKIIAGEQKRMSMGGVPIYNPTIAKVKVHFDIFMQSYEKQKDLQMATARSLDTLAAMRHEADALILDVWNQVEKKFENVTPNERRLDMCRDYGLVYYYRTGEVKPGL